MLLQSLKRKLSCSIHSGRLEDHASCENIGTPLSVVCSQNKASECTLLTQMVSNDNFKEKSKRTQSQISNSILFKMNLKIVITANNLKM